VNIFITGGAGFIGSNLAHHYLLQGHTVIVFDNLSRRGSDKNLAWLQANHGSKLRFIRGDVRDYPALLQAVAGADRVYHMASQVAVTTSVIDPRTDFEINALGTFNVLEAVRAAAPQAIVFYASTNKVYGGMEHVAIVEEQTRYRYRDLPNGIPEGQLLDFHSPYGCSKGAGDQYVRDYARIYGLKTVVFRQSCLAADQEVITPFGKKPIHAVRPGDIVHSGKSWTRVRHVWQTGVKPVRRLTTMNGLQVTLTADHLVFRPHGLFSSRSLAYGDFVAVLPEAQHMPKWEPIPDRVLAPEAYLAAVRVRTSDLRCLNEAERIAERLLPLEGDHLLGIAEVVGWLFGDGHLGIHQRQAREHPAYTVQYFGSESELQELTLRLNWLGISPSSIIRWEATSELPSGHTIQGHSCRIQQQSIPIFTLFEMLGVPVGDKVRVDYELPEWVSGGHPLVKRAFLRGFLGAELCKVNPDSRLAPSFAQSKDITHLENGRRWVEQLRNLLAEFGIETSYFEAEPVSYQRGTTVQMTIRLLGGSELPRKLAAIGYAFSNERAGKLNALLRWQWTHTAPDWFDQTNQIYQADGQLFWDSVMTIEEVGEQPVYDLEIEDDTHLFLGGGIQVSNCIYGTRQFGVEDQGWVAHFCIAAALGRPITIYGNGKQVRDVLWIDDLVRAYDLAAERVERVAGKIYNIGGGPENAMSIWAEFGPILEELAGHPIPVKYGDWRPGDQPVYISDISLARRELGWSPRVGVREGIQRLWDWVRENPHLFD